MPISSSRHSVVSLHSTFRAHMLLVPLDFNDSLSYNTTCPVPAGLSIQLGVQPITCNLAWFPSYVSMNQVKTAP